MEAGLGELLGSKLTIPVLKDRSMALVNAFVAPRVERHDGGASVPLVCGVRLLIASSAGHHTPSKASWRHFFKAYLTTEGAGEIPSPVGSQTEVVEKL